MTNLFVEAIHYAMRFACLNPYFARLLDYPVRLLDYPVT